MQVVLNGESRTLNNPLTVRQLLEQLDLEGKIAIEINEAIVPRSQYGDVRIQPGDRIEVVRAVGGG